MPPNRNSAIERLGRVTQPLQSIPGKKMRVAPSVKPLQETREGVREKKPDKTNFALIL